MRADDLIADDLIIGANTVDELLSNNADVLQRLQENNLCLAADKTTICPKSLNILGWLWKDGTLKSDPHKINPLKTCQQPKTLEDVVAGTESNSKILKSKSFKDTIKLGTL